MVLTPEDIEALRTVIRDELQQEMRPLRDDVGGMRGELTTVQGELKEVSSRTAQQGLQIGAVQTGLEATNAAMLENFERVNQNFAAAMLENFERVNENFATIEERIDELESNMNSQFDAISKTLETTEQENLVIKYQLAELEKKIA